MSANVTGNWTIGPAPAAPFSPSDIAGLQLWLKADSLSLSNDDPVTTWSDSSGSGNDATSSGSSRPLFKTNVFNGKPALSFDNTDDGMVVSPLSVSLPFTLFIVYNYPTTVSGTHRAIQGINGNWLIGPWDSSVHSYYNGAFINGPSISFGTPVSGSVTQATGTAEFFVNGTSYGTNSNNTTPGGIQLGAPVIPGSPPFLEYLGGHIAEVICYDSVLASGNRALVEAYLNTRYAMY